VKIGIDEINSSEKIEILIFHTSTEDGRQIDKPWFAPDLSVHLRYGISKSVKTTAIGVIANVVFTRQ
jgi:hypothetical protein